MGFRAILPSGFRLPGTPYLVVLATATVAVLASLRATRPTVSQPVVLAFIPWMVVGAALRVLQELAALPALVAPLFGTPAVYLSLFVLAGGCWSALLRLRADGDDVARSLGEAGLALALAAFGAIIWLGWQQQTLLVLWPMFGIALAAVLTAVVTLGYRSRFPDAAAATGPVGVFVIFGHTLDATSTAIGIDVLGAGEKSPLPARILAFAAELPTAELIGAGWLFVLVKLVIAVAVVHVAADIVRERPSEGYLLLALVAAVGFGPGVHNLFLFIANAGA
jgi:uncharacterized membrane protein